MEKNKVIYSDGNNYFYQISPTEFTLLRLITKFDSEESFEKIVDLVNRPNLLEVFNMFDYKNELTIDDMRNEKSWNYNYIKKIMGDLVDLGLIKGISYNRWRLN